MTLLLAPMEGLLDHTLRDLLTRVGGVDRCVSEFIRITDQLLPPRVFTRIVPELHNASRTPSGVPVRPQLLGSDPVCVAENAAVLAELRPAGIDLNFGCPAKTVNRHRGGAVLLDEPELVHAIVAAVRRAVPTALPVSAKMRLGHRDDARALDCARAIADAGANELVVHARTKLQGYRPPAYWSRVRDIRDAVPHLPLVANGDIWTVEDAQRCRAESGCHALMLGRGMVRNPGLARAIRALDAPALGLEPPAVTAVPWREVLLLLDAFWCQISRRVPARHRAGRIKQWLGSLRMHYPEAQTAFDALRRCHEPAGVEAWLVANSVRRGEDAVPSSDPAKLS